MTLGAATSVYVERAHAVYVRRDVGNASHWTESWGGGARIERHDLEHGDSLFCDSVSAAELTRLALSARRALTIECSDELRTVASAVESRPDSRDLDSALAAELLDEAIAALSRSEPIRWTATVHLSNRVVGVWTDSGAATAIRAMYRVSLRVQGQVPDTWGLGSVCWNDHGVRPGRADLALAAQQAIDQSRRLSTAAVAPTGNFEMVLSPDAASTVVHEVIGHLLEADNHAMVPTLLPDGSPVAPPCLSTTEGAADGSDWGSFAVDDEGTTTVVTPLVAEGQVVGQLTDKAQSSLLSKPRTGHAIRATHRDPSLPRMGRLRTHAGSDSPDALLSSVRAGLYVHSFSFGEVNPRTGLVVLRIREAQDIAHGRLGAWRRGGRISLPAGEILAGLTAVASDVAWTPSLCRKKGQDVAVADRAPTMLFAALPIAA